MVVNLLTYNQQEKKGLEVQTRHTRSPVKKKIINEKNSGVKKITLYNLLVTTYVFSVYSLSPGSQFK